MTKIAKPHIVLLLDESGSMQASRRETVNSANEYIAKLKEELPGGSILSVVKFTTGEVERPVTFGLPPVPSTGIKITRLIDQKPLKDVKPLTIDDYTPSAWTPLYDAIGSTINAITVKDVPVFFAIVTDGAENASREFNRDSVMKLITDKTAKGWTFAFMGVDIEAYGEASSLGVMAVNTVSATRSTFGTAMKMSAADSVKRYASYEAQASMGTSFGDWAIQNATEATFDAKDKAEVEKKP